MKPDIGQLMKQLQSVQSKMEEAQQALAQEDVTGEAGAGLVKVTISGRHQVRRVQIDPSLLGDDRALLEDLVAAATNDALRRVETLVQERMGSMAAGMGMPGSMTF